MYFSSKVFNFKWGRIDLGPERPETFESGWIQCSCIPKEEESEGGANIRFYLSVFESYNMHIRLFSEINLFFYFLLIR